MAHSPPRVCQEAGREKRAARPQVSVGELMIRVRACPSWSASDALGLQEQDRQGSRACLRWEKQGAAAGNRRIDGR